jgi:DNA helicase IV
MVDSQSQFLRGQTGTMASHPDLSSEQAYIDHAYESLEKARHRATRLRTMVEVGKGGTEQARWEREMIEESIAQRLAHLHLGDASLVFGRIDRTAADGGDTFYIGRLAVADVDQEPLVVDWRAPVAEPFYAGTSRREGARCSTSRTSCSASRPASSAAS